MTITATLDQTIELAGADLRHDGNGNVYLFDPDGTGATLLMSETDPDKIGRPYPNMQVGSTEVWDGTIVING